MRVFIFIHTTSIGGAEKRFIGLWKSLQEVGPNFFLVMHEELHQKFPLTGGLGRSLQEAKDNVLFLESDSGISFRKQYKNFIDRNIKDGDVLHFVGEHPFLKPSKNKTVFTITQSSLKNLNYFGKAGQFLGVLLSNHNDILDPSIYRTMRRAFFFKRSAITLTSNSFCDIDLYNPVPYEQKKDWLVFLGRFISLKQVIPLIKALPQIHEKIKSVAVNDLHYYFLGYGEEENEIKTITAAPAYNNIPITIEYNEKPAQILRQSKVFFSLQLHNNYPSRSLIEAMAAGNIPVVTDVGDTRWLAKPEFSYYVPEYFTNDQLSEVLSTIYGKGSDQMAHKSMQAREFVKHEHTIEKMREYYLSVYNKNV